MKSLSWMDLRRWPKKQKLRLLKLNLKLESKQLRLAEHHQCLMYVKSSRPTSLLNQGSLHGPTWAHTYRLTAVRLRNTIILKLRKKWHCNCIVMTGGVYNEISPEPKGNHEGGARVISRGLRRYFIVLLSSHHNTVILNYLYQWIFSRIQASSREEAQYFPVLGFLRRPNTDPYCPCIRQYSCPTQISTTICWHYHLPGQ